MTVCPKTALHARVLESRSRIAGGVSKEHQQIPELAPSLLVVFWRCLQSANLSKHGLPVRGVDRVCRRQCASVGGGEAKMRVGTRRDDEHVGRVLALVAVEDGGLDGEVAEAARRS